MIDSLVISIETAVEILYILTNVFLKVSFIQ